MRRGPHQLAVAVRRGLEAHVAWRVGAEGKALQWWIERLADPRAMKGILRSAGRALAAERVAVPRTANRAGRAA